MGIICVYSFIHDFFLEDNTVPVQRRHRYMDYRVCIQERRQLSVEQGLDKDDRCPDEVVSFMLDPAHDYDLYHPTR